MADLFLDRLKNSSHCLADVGAIDEPSPDEAGTKILGAKQHNAQIDARHLAVYPTRFGMEYVDETVGCRYFFIAG